MTGVADVVICSAARTPFSKFGGVMRDCSSVELSAIVFREVVQRSGIQLDQVDEIILGMARAGEAALSNGIVARQALLKAGFLDETVSVTIDRACCSSITAIQMGSYRLQAGEARFVIAAGADNMGREPFMLPPAIRWGWKRGPLEADDTLFELGYKGHGAVAADSGRVAVEYGISREEQDDWAFQSQMRYQEARQAGRFTAEIVPVTLSVNSRKSVTVTEDEPPRPETTREKLAQLPTIYGSPTVTAGNAPGLDTGAGALLLTTRGMALEQGLKPWVTVLATSSVAVDSAKLPIGPAKAIQKLCAKSGISLESIDLIEINEAFAAVPLVSAKILSEGNDGIYRQLLNRLNVNGGAIAIGHPVGASGSRITMTLANELRRRGGGYGVAAICGGLGQADAVLLRVEAN